MPNNDDHTITYICEKCKYKEVKEKKYVGGEFCKPLEEITIIFTIHASLTVIILPIRMHDPYAVSQTNMEMQEILASSSQVEHTAHCLWLADVDS